MVDLMSLDPSSSGERSGLNISWIIFMATIDCPGNGGAADVRRRDLMLLFGVAVDRLLVSLSGGCDRTRYQIDKAAMTATTTPTMIEGSRVDEGAHFFASAGLPVSP